MITSEDHQSLVSDWDTFNDNEKAQAQSLIIEYRQYDQQQKVSAAEKAYSDLETLGGQWNAERQKLLSPIASDINTEKAAVANIRYFSALRGEDPAQTASIYPLLRDQMAREKYGKDKASDTELYGLLKSDLDTRKKREEQVQSLAASATEAAFSAALDEKSPGWGAAFDTLRATDPELKPEDWTIHLEAYRRAKALASENKELFQVARDALLTVTGSKSSQRGDFTETMSEAATRLADVPETDKRAVYGMLTLWADKNGGRKGFIEQLGESAGRSAGSMVRGVASAQNELSLLQRKRELESGVPDSLSGGTDALGPESKDLTPEQRNKELAEVEKALAVNNTLRELRHYAETVVDPIKDVMPRGSVGNLAERAAYGLASTAPYMATAAIPYAGLPLVSLGMAGQDYDRIRLEFPDIEPEKAALISSVSGAVKGAIEKAQLGLVLGRTPLLNGVLKKLTTPTSSFWKRALITTGTGIVEQNAQEFIQDITTPVVQNIVSALDSDVPGVDWKSQLGGWEGRLDTFVTLLPLTLIGAGVHSYKESSFVRKALTRPDWLEFSGIDSSTAAQIAATAAIDPAAAEEQFQAAWQARTPEAVKAGADKLEAEAARVEAMQASPDTPTVRRTAAGAYEVLTPDGKVESTHADEEAAYAASVDLRAGLEADNLQSVRDLAEAFNEKDTKRRVEVLEKIKTDKDAIGEGLATPEQVAERMRIAGITEGGAQILGENVHDVAEGIFTDVSRIYTGASVADVIEERTHGSFKKALHEGRVSIEDAEAATQAWAEEHPEFALTPEMTAEQRAVVTHEAVADMAKAHFFGKHRSLPNLPTSVRAFIKRMAVFFRQVFKRAATLEKLKREGKLSKDWQEFLAESVGLGGVAEMQRQTAEAASALAGVQFSIGPMRHGSISDFMARWDGEGVKSFLSEKNGVITLSQVEVPKEQRGQGIGTQFMGELTAYADATQQRIALTPDTSFGASSVERLKRFYRRFGFEKNTDLSVSASMLREPASRLPELEAKPASVTVHELNSKGKVVTEPAFSLAPGTYLDRINERMDALLAGSPSERLAIRERAKAKLIELDRSQRFVLKVDKQKVGASKEELDRTRMLHAFATLDAIVATFPKEIRGAIGGASYAKLSQYKTAAARSRYIADRIEKIGAELEKLLRADYDTAFRKLLNRSKPTKAGPGKKPVGKAGADAHALFATLAEAMEWTSEAAQAHADALEASVLSGELSPEQEAHATIEAQLVPLVSDWKHADATRRAAAYENAKRVWEDAYQRFQIKKTEQAERRAATRQELITATGKAGTADERDAKTLADNGLKGRWKDTILGLLNFEQVLQWTFGENSEVAQRLADMERKASNARDDAVFEKEERLRAMFERLAGSDYKGTQLQWKLAQKNLEIGKRKLSELEAITATLMWRQEDGRRHMDGKRDENNQVVSSWHYDQAFIDEIESKLSDEAKVVREHIAAEYAGEYATLNPVYKALNGVNLPRNPNYSPLTVKPQQAQGGQSIDPVTGSTMSAGSSTPGSLRTRGAAVAEPDFRDALQTFIAHTKQIEHWKAYAPFAAEAQALLNHREVGNSVEAAGGNQAVSVLRGWLDYFAQGGTRDAGAHLALNSMLSRISGRAASVALVGSIGTIAIQSAQLGAALAEMPTGAYVKRLAQLLSGNLGWGKALHSPYIQRRIAQMPVVVRQGVEGLRAEKPGRLRHEVQKLGRLIGGADALFTAGTYAMVYDYQLGQAKGLGLIHSEQEEFAHNAAERITDRIAQPTRAGARSLFENTATNPIVRVAWAFASEGRKNLALVAYSLANRTPAQKVRALTFVFILNGLMVAIIRSAWRDARDPDDDELFDERNWDLRRMALTVATEPLQGLPIIGTAAQAAAFKLAGEWNPEGNLFSGAVRGAQAFKHVDDILSGDQDTRQTVRDVQAMIAGAGLMNSDIAAAASLARLAKDLFDVEQNVVGD